LMHKNAPRCNIKISPLGRCRCSLSELTPEPRHPENMNISERIRALRGDKTQSDFADLTKIPKNTLGRYERGEIVPGGEAITLLCKNLDVDPNWLLFGEGPMRRGGTAETVSPIPADEPPWMSPETAPAMGYTLIPKVKARLCAGTGSLETSGDVVGLYAFKTDFLKRKGRARKMVLMDVTGDSMEPDVWSGDTVLIDESQREIIPGGLFAIGLESEVFVKYLDRIPGKLVLRSKNPDYPPIEVDMNGHVEAVRIIGRVVWSCREYVR